MTFRVEVTNPFAPDDRDDERFDCSDFQDLVSRLQSVLHWGPASCLLAAISIAFGTEFEEEAEDESGFVVTAERVGAVV